MADIKPNAVVFIATEILDDNRSAFSAGSAPATAVKAWIKPMIVPSNPSKGGNICKCCQVMRSLFEIG